MLNPKLIDSLTDAIDTWMQDNADEQWWLDGAGYVSEDCTKRLATMCALALQESKAGQEYADEDRGS